MRVGVISDTHGLLRPEAVRALAGVDLILHAGDVGGRSIVAELEKIAPTRAVRGNVDDADSRLPQSLRLTLDGVSVHVSHGHELGSPTPQRLLAAYDADVIVYGHTHRALLEQHGATLVLNPGAAGPGRFRLRPSVALLDAVRGAVSATIIPLSG